MSLDAWLCCYALGAIALLPVQRDFGSGMGLVALIAPAIFNGVLLFDTPAFLINKPKEVELTLSFFFVAISVLLGTNLGWQVAFGLYMYATCLLHVLHDRRATGIAIMIVVLTSASLVVSCINRHDRIGAATYLVLFFACSSNFLRRV